MRLIELHIKLIFFKLIHIHVHTHRFVLSNLAKFHAASYAFIEEEVGGRDKFRENWELVCVEAFLIENPMMAQMFDNGVNTCLNILKVKNMCVYKIPKLR